MGYTLHTDKTWSETHRELADCFGRWGIRDWSAEPNVPLARVNNMRLTKEERAVTVRWMPNGAANEVVLSLDTQQTPAANLRAIFLCVDGMRLMDVRGVGHLMQSAYVQLAAPVRERDPYEVLGLRPGASSAEIEAMYRVKAKALHPDAPGGSEEAMKVLNAARERLLERTAVNA